MTKFVRGDWVADQSDRVAKVKAVRLEDGEVLLDLVMYNDEGERLGRISPALGGPRHFEPCCASDGWRPIHRPQFPLRIVWKDTGNGTRTARKDLRET